MSKSEFIQIDKFNIVKLIGLYISYCILLSLATPVIFSYFRIIKVKLSGISYCCFNKVSQLFN